MKVTLMANILEKNEQFAWRVRQCLAEQQIFALNLMGSPGSGKTSLLEHTIARLKDTLRLAVIEGDLFTSKDAKRIEAQGIPVIQINTGGGCHLDAAMIERTLSMLPLADIDLLIIENVGNLVCPAEFDLGEDEKAVVYSIAEGEDKPLKYPLIFKDSATVILNKIDLLPYTCFDMALAAADILSLNPSVQLLEVSCRTGQGLGEWLSWLEAEVKQKKSEDSVNARFEGTRPRH